MRTMPHKVDCSSINNFNGPLTFCVLLGCFLRNDQIFAAASFSDILKELLLHRPSGLLSLWRADGPRQDEIQIIIENGRPTHARRGLYEEYISTSTLLWLNGWRNIYFTFQLKRAILQLPAPADRLPSVTRPLSAITLPPPAPVSPSLSENAYASALLTSSSLIVPS